LEVAGPKLQPKALGPPRDPLSFPKRWPIGPGPTLLDLADGPLPPPRRRSHQSCPGPRQLRYEPSLRDHQAHSSEQDELGTGVEARLGPTPPQQLREHGDPDPSASAKE